MAQLMLPLFEALKRKPKTLTWDDDMKGAFEETKTALAKTSLLAHPSQGAQISMATNALDVAAGALLQQLVDGVWLPLAIFSRKLRTPKRKYNTFDCELLALYLGVRHFRYFLEEWHFTAYTDHKPLPPSQCRKPQTHAPKDSNNGGWLISWSS